MKVFYHRNSNFKQKLFLTLNYTLTKFGQIFVISCLRIFALVKILEGTVATSPELKKVAEHVSRPAVLKLGTAILMGSTKQFQGDRKEVMDF